MNLKYVWSTLFYPDVSHLFTFNNLGINRARNHEYRFYTHCFFSDDSRGVHRIERDVL